MVDFRTKLAGQIDVETAYSDELKSKIGPLVSTLSWSV